MTNPIQPYRSFLWNRSSHSSRIVHAVQLESLMPFLHKTFVLIIITCSLIFLHLSCTSDKTSFSNTVRYKDSLENITSDPTLSDLDLENMLSQSLREGNSIASMLLFKEKGRRMRTESKFIDAVHFHKKYLEEAIDVNDTIEIISALNSLGTDYRRLNILDEASQYHYQALLISESFIATHPKEGYRGMTFAYNGLGNVSLSLTKWDEAEQFFQKALKEELKIDNYLGVAINYANIGACKEGSNQDESAKNYYLKSLRYNRLARSQMGQGLCHIHLGGLLEKKHEYAKAEKQYRTAFMLMQQSSDKWHWLEPCISLSRIHLLLKRYADFHQSIIEAETIATALPSSSHLIQIYALKSQYYEETGDTKQALEYLKLSHTLQDSTMSLPKVNMVSDYRINYEREKGNREIQLLKKKNIRNEKINRYTIIITGLVFLIFAFIILFLTYSSRQRIKSNKMLREMSNFRSNFYTNITHEFRTPITVIQGLSEQLSNEETMSRELQLNYLQAIRRQSGNLLRLINDILDISKLNSKTFEPEWKRGNFVVFIGMLVETFEILAKQKHINLKFNSECPIITMDFVPFYIEKIINNLLSNAIKNTKAQGEILVNLRCIESEEKAVLSISDNGIGINQEDLKNIFKLFYQGGRHSIPTGSGVGLYYTQLLVREMNGTIEVDSQEGVGSVFTVTLPLQSEKQKNIDLWSCESPFKPITSLIQEELQPLKTDEDNDSDAGSEGKLKILIVEDNKDVQLYIQSLLQSRYSLITAENGKEGLEKASESIPDIIVSDIMMPIMDGYQFCDSIKNSALLNHIPVILLTARTTEEDKIEGLRCGADAYIKKPFNAEELSLQIENILTRRDLQKEKYIRAFESEYERREIQTNDIENSDVSQQNDENIKFVFRVTRIIQDNIQTSGLSSSFIASQLYMSVSQLNRKLNAIIGSSATVLINQIKIRKAKKLLRHTDISIADVAGQCGYYDPPYFTRTFKKATGLTPSQYQAQLNLQQEE